MKSQGSGRLANQTAAAQDQEASREADWESGVGRLRNLFEEGSARKIEAIPSCTRGGGGGHSIEHTHTEGVTCERFADTIESLELCGGI